MLKLCSGIIAKNTVGVINVCVKEFEILFVEPFLKTE